MGPLLTYFINLCRAFSPSNCSPQSVFFPYNTVNFSLRPWTKLLWNNYLVAFCFIVTEKMDSSRSLTVSIFLLRISNISLVFVAGIWKWCYMLTKKWEIWIVKSLISILDKGCFSNDENGGKNCPILRDVIYGPK